MIPANSSASNNNSNNMSGCEAVSSNCVVWQGPDLECVDICHGDTISTVIAALCEQLVICCEEASINAFDIDVINQTTLNGGPATTLEELIQLIINNIGTGGGGSHSSDFGCAEVMKCDIQVAECLQSQAGQTVMSLNSYIQFLATLICSIQDQIAVLQVQVNSNTTRITALESQGEYTTPTRMAAGNLAGGAVTAGQTYPIDTLLDALDTDYVSFRNATGEVGTWNTAVSAQPANLQPLIKASWPASYNANPTVGGQSLANAWAVADDLREYSQSLEARIAIIENNCCSSESGSYRMLNATTEYMNGATCSAACTAAAPEGDVPANCFAIWNSSGVLFDSNVKAYLDSTMITELTNAQWYAVCPGGTTVVAKYSTTYPHWTGMVTCDAGEEGGCV
jgi:hypothetical protein